MWVETEPEAEAEAEAVAGLCLLVIRPQPQAQTLFIESRCPEYSFLCGIIGLDGWVAGNVGTDSQERGSVLCWSQKIQFQSVSEQTVGIRS